MGLDLSRIEAWTREMLEAEARRRRIRGPEFRTRGELVRLLLKHQYGDRVSAGRERFAKGVRAVEHARGILTGVLEGALSSLPEPIDALTRLRARLPGASRTQAAPNPPPIEAAKPAQPERTEPAATRAAAPERMPSSVAPSTRTFVEEPIRTHSMARLLAFQGHRERALAIYEELLAQNSEDDALRHEADAVRRGLPVEPPALPDPPAIDLARAVMPEGNDVLQCEGAPDAGLRLRWQITADGQRRARAVLGRDGELAVRVVTIRPDPDQVVRSEITEHGPVNADDAWQSPPVPENARCFVAIGLREGDKFVAIVHAHPNAAPLDREAVQPQFAG